MTKDELLIHQIQIKVYVHRMAVEQMWKVLIALPGAEQPLRNWAMSVIEKASSQYVRGVHPAISDMTAQEYQEALREMFDGLL